MGNKHTCIGCGEVLQHSQPQAMGYTPKPDSNLCMRCFRWRQYKDIDLLLKHSPNYDIDWQAILNSNATLVYVVDSFFVHESIISGLARKLNQQPVTIVATKTDVYPNTITKSTIRNHIIQTLKANHILIKDCLIGSAKPYDQYQEVKTWLSTLDPSNPILFFGTVNSGKSTLINTLFDHLQLTTAPIPNTTTSFVEHKHDRWTIIDTPGVPNQDQLFAHVSLQLWQKLQLTGLIHPKTYPAQQSATFECKDLFRVTVLSDHPYSVTLYAASDINLVASKKEKAPIEKWKRINVEALKENTWINLPSIGKLKITGNNLKIRLTLPEYMYPTYSKQEITW